MTSAKALIVYFSQGGTTARVADAIATGIQQADLVAKGQKRKCASEEANTRSGHFSVAGDGHPSLIKINISLSYLRWACHGYGARVDHGRLTHP